ncbi:DUF2141 domain-containing protein [Usitatibacter palustris]|uniref:DUF2141 domain-containing protein n=1 Tax=Usitatibacter palustris TaxID=2732487 RepID=A0A6M4H4P1_9PROT|nr:DUF2141 domain-containing protein [Usitatibacter palustris]QJR14546.1 hypothetical protein DSM104440_01347 [Usitatibacter palustris]
MNRLQAALACSTLALSAAASAADIAIEVKGITEAKGNIMVAVYDKADQWLGKPLKYARVPAAMPSVTVSIEGLEAGVYAVSIYQDIDSNGKLDTNVMRIPIEPIGFSNDATGSFGPPKFEDARIQVPASGTRIVINLKG